MSSTNIYKGVPALNTLNVDVSNMAPDNLTLESYKGLLKIGEEFDKTQQTANYYEAITKLDITDTEYKNAFLSNKNVDFQKADFRESALKGLNEAVEAKKKIVMDTKGIDGALKQKLYQHLAGKSGELALELHKDVLTYETKENIDNSIRMKNNGITLLKQSGINSDRSEYYQMIFDSVDRLSFFGEDTAKIMVDTVKQVVEAESWGQNVFLREKLFGKDLRYNEILGEFEAWKKSVISDEYLDKKASEIISSFKGTGTEKEKYRNAVKGSLKAEYEKLIMEQTPYVMQQYETQLEREQNQKNFLLQHELDKERLDFEKRSDAERATQGYIDRGDLLGGLSSSVGYPVTTATLLTDGNKLFRKATNWEIKDAVRSMKYAEIIKPEMVNYLDGEKKNVYARGQGIDSFISGYLSGEMNSLPSYDAKELYIRNASAKGLAPYGLLKAYYINDKDYRTMANLVTFIDTHKGEAKNFLDLAQSENNGFSNYITKTLGMNTIEQKALSDWVSAMAQTNSFGNKVVIPNDRDFTRNVTNYYLTNEDFRREVQNAAKLIQKTYNQPRFELLPINTNIVKESGDRAVQNSQQVKVYTDVSNKGRTNAGTTRTTGGNNNQGRGNSNSKGTYKTISEFY